MTSERSKRRDFLSLIFIAKLIWCGNCNYRFAVVRFLVVSESNWYRKECTNPGDKWFTMWRFKCPVQLLRWVVRTLKSRINYLGVYIDQNSLKLVNFTDLETNNKLSIKQKLRCTELGFIGFFLHTDIFYQWPHTYYTVKPPYFFPSLRTCARAVNRKVGRWKRASDTGRTRVWGYRASREILKPALWAFVLAIMRGKPTVLQLTYEVVLHKVKKEKIHYKTVYNN